MYACEMVEHVRQSPWRDHNDESLIKGPHTLHQSGPSQGAPAENGKYFVFDGVKGEGECLIKHISQRTFRINLMCYEEKVLAPCLNDFRN